MASTYTFNNIKKKDLSLQKKTLIYRYCPVTAVTEMPENIDNLPQGKEVTIIAMDHSAKTNTWWYMVKYDTSKIGWINNGLNNNILDVVFLEQNTPSPNSSGEIALRDLYQYKYLKTLKCSVKADCIIWDRLPVKGGAVNKETIKSGTKVNITDMGYSSNTCTFWYKVTYGKNNAYSGWINNGNNNNRFLVLEFDTASYTKSKDKTTDKPAANKKPNKDKSPSNNGTKKVNTTMVTAANLSKKLEEIYNDNKNEIENLILANGVEYSPNNNALWYNRFDRFGITNPYNALMGNCKEYLFFVKPDLNLVYTHTEKHGLNSNLAERTFFRDLRVNNPEVINALQYSLNHTPFIPLLTNSVNNTLQIQNLEADTIEGPANIYGTKIDYRGSSYKSNEDISFSLEFKDDELRGTYQLFKAYDEYESLKQRGLLKYNFAKKNLNVTDQRYLDYTQRKILHDRFGLYKIVVGSDGETIVFYSYIWGAMPMNVPRDAYSEIEPGRRIIYNIDWKASFVEDNDPIILYEFQNLCNQIMPAKENRVRINWYVNSQQRMSGKRARCPGIEVITDSDGRRYYKLAWYYDKEADKKKNKGGLFDL